MSVLNNFWLDSLCTCEQSQNWLTGEFESTKVLAAER